MIEREIIERLYRVFKGYSADSLALYSPMNDPEAMAHWTKVLRARPLRELQPDDLRYFTFKTMTTWGEVEAFKHFLPRMLELSTHFEWNGMEVEIVFGKLAYGHWQTWPTEEQAALTPYVTALWQFLVDTEDPRADEWINDYLRSFVNAGVSWLPLLNTWIAAGSEASVGRLCRFIIRKEEEILIRGRFGWSKEQQHEHGAALQRWLRSAEMKQHLSDHFFRYIDTPSANIISDALQIVERTDYFDPKIRFFQHS